MKRNRAIFIVVALVAIFFAALLVKQRQELRKLAQEPPKIAQIAISSERLEEGIARVDVMIRTGPEGGRAHEIGAVSFRLVYGMKDGEGVSVVDENGYATNVIFTENELDSEKWQYPVNKVWLEDETINIDFAAVYVDEKGYSTNISKKIAHFYIKFDNGNFDDLYNLRLDDKLSAIMTKKEPTRNVLNVSEGGLLNIEFSE